ncbi:MAG: MFS transporter [Verrucomicrobiales bacterium]
MNQADLKVHAARPWSWVPTLYFAQGIPYVMVMTVSVILYKRLGLSNADIALYTSWLYLPWVIKPFWSPVVELLKRKRWWIIATELIIGAALAGVAFAIPAPNYLQWTLALFWLLAFTSATHDVAADGFYLLGLDEREQAFYVGVRSTFYRLAMIAGQGLLIMLAGALEKQFADPPASFTLRVGETAAEAAGSTRVSQTISNRFYFSETHLITEPKPWAREQAAPIVSAAKLANQTNGFTMAPATSSSGAGVEKSLWSQYVSEPTGAVLKKWFAPSKPPASKIVGSIEAVELRFRAKPETEVILNLQRTSGDAGFKIIEGEQLRLTPENWDKPAKVLIQIDPQLRGAAHATFETVSGKVGQAWRWAFLFVAGFFLLICLYHHLVLPRPTADRSQTVKGVAGFVREFAITYAAFFRKPDVLRILLFILFYRFAEAQLVKIASLFLLDNRSLGGLGLSTSEVGFVYGTVGVLSLTLGGLLGGFLVARDGLRKWLWPMALAINAPNLVYVYLSWAQPDNFVIINVCVAVEQFGYGLGFTAFMLYLIQASAGQYPTAHYAICTGFMALGMMGPGMFSGWLQEIIGYKNFFVWVMIATIPSFIVVALIRVKPYGTAAASKE